MKVVLTKFSAFKNSSKMFQEQLIWSFLTSARASLHSRWVSFLRFFWVSILWTQINGSKTPKVLVPTNLSLKSVTCSIFFFFFWILSTNMWTLIRFYSLHINVLVTSQIKMLNPFQANVPFLYPIKMLENQRFSDVFRRYRKGTLAWIGLMTQFISLTNILKHFSCSFADFHKREQIYSIAIETFSAVDLVKEI